MIFKFWEKQKEIPTQKMLLRKLIRKLEISEVDKVLFLEAINKVDEIKIESLYGEIVDFIKHSELKEINEIEKNNFVSIDGMTLKEADKTRKEINSFNFLMSNI